MQMPARAVINVSVSSHYREDSYASETVTQGILGEWVEVIEHRPLFSRVRQEDGYTSWISTDQLAFAEPPAGIDVQVRSHFIAIRSEPSADAAVIRDAVIGAKLAAAAEENGWTRVILPDGMPGWVETKHFGSFPPATPDQVIGLVREFLGYQYVWGGRTPKGFDCSGLVQTAFALHGTKLPRDAWQQQEHHIVSDRFGDGIPGDLFFFARTPEKVTHVAVCIGHGRFIHASGWVRHNSLNQADADFSKDHVDTFVSVNRYPPEL